MTVLSLSSQARMVLSTLARIAQGESGAMHECITQHGPLVWSLARRLSRTRCDAEDATQEIFLQIWCQAGRYNPALGAERTFIATIARRRLIDRLRTATATPRMHSFDETHAAAAATDPEEFQETCEAAGRALQMLKELRAEHRQVIELGCLQGLTHAEIAARLALPLGTVKTFMRRGLTRIRERLDQDGKRALAAEQISPCATGLIVRSYWINPLRNA